MTSEPVTSLKDHSDLVGGSTAERRINCPGSYLEEQKIPESVRRKSSSYADEGTALHAAVEFILNENIINLDEIVGMEFNVAKEGEEPRIYKITKKQVTEAIVPCIDFFDALDDELQDEGGLQFMTEGRCQMPGIPGAFGTSDIIGRSDKRSVIVDWKFGSGVPVKAAYPSEEDESVLRPNSQLMFYARAATHSFPGMFGDGDDWPVDLYIVQPRARNADDTIFSHYQTTRRELEDFRLRLIRAVAEASGQNASKKRGDWCRFAACKTTCELHTGPLLDLTKMHKAIEAKKNAPAEVADVDWGELYADYLDIADGIELVTNELRAQAKAFVEAGGTIRDRKLVDTRPTESYVDEEGAKQYALSVDKTLEEKDVLEEPALRSPAQLAAVLEPFMEGSTKKARTEKAREAIAAFTKKVSSGTKLVHENAGGTPILATPVQLKLLGDKLAALKGQ